MFKGMRRLRIGGTPVYHAELEEAARRLLSPAEFLAWEHDSQDDINHFPPGCTIAALTPILAAEQSVKESADPTPMRQLCEARIRDWLSRKNRAGASPPASEAPPPEWSRGLKRIAWEEARKIVSEVADLSGPLLWNAMCARTDCVRVSGITLRIKNPTGFERQGEGECSRNSVNKKWTRDLKDLLGIR